MGTHTGLFGWVCVSCAYILTLPVVGGGCGCVVGLGISVFGEHAHCRVHVQHRVSVCCPVVGWWLPAQSAWIVCGVGVGCVWWVVCVVYSGCERFCFVLFFVFCLVLLGIRWMPWHQELMKDVAACDMPRGAGERALLSEGVRMGEPNLGCAGLPSSERV